MHQMRHFSLPVKTLARITLLSSILAKYVARLWKGTSDHREAQILARHQQYAIMCQCSIPFIYFFEKLHQLIGPLFEVCKEAKVPFLSE